MSNPLSGYARLLAFLMIVALPSLVHAQTCSLTISNMNFGSPSLIAGGAVDTTATVTVSCTGTPSGTNYICLSLDDGSGGVSGTTRLMTGPSATLRYNLYQDAARSIQWGSRANPALGSIPRRQVTGPSYTFVDTIYGRILPGQATTPVDSYSSAFSGTDSAGFTLNSSTTNCTTGANGGYVYASFNVLASVAANCDVSASPLNFGISTGLSAGVVDATATLSVTCTSPTAYTIGLGNGLTGTGPTARTMKSGSNGITYGLYRDSARSQPWSSVAGGMASGTGTGAAQSFTVYGRVAASQTPPVGSYSDTVVITVSF